MNWLGFGYGLFYDGEKMKVTNYMKLRSWRPFTCQYMFLDTINQESKYLVITCRIRKCYEERFKEALAVLPDKMLLMGHTDYEDFCKELFDS